MALTKIPSSLLDTTSGLSLSGDITLVDNDKAIFGTGSDLQIYHNGNNSFITDTGTGNLYLRAANNLFVQGATDNDALATFQEDGFVKLYFNNAEKLATTNSGIDVTGVITTDGLTTSADINFGDNDKAVFGDGSDLQIYSDGNNSIINEVSSTGSLLIQGSHTRIKTANGVETLAEFIANGAVTLYYDNSAKLATTSTGIDVTGNIVVSGTVDGRDIATDGTKLDTIETNADVTDTTNVTAAGALMDSEITNLAQVKAFDSSDYATAAQGTTADSALQNIVEDTTPQLGGDLASNGNDILFADSDKAIFGTGSDLRIYHDGSHSYVADIGTGNLRLLGNDLRLQTADGIENYLRANLNGSVQLYYDNAEKLATTSTGIDVTGVITTDGLTTSADINFGDSDKAIFGAGSDLQIYHDSSNSYIVDSGTGDLNIQATNLSIKNASGGSNYLRATTGGALLIYYSGAQKLATSNTGVTITGEIEATSFSDGTISGITFIDEDSFATNSATRVPTQQSIKAYVDTQVAGVVDSAPAALDTLNELAAALGDDANFSTTTSTALGNRLRVDTAAQGLTGTQQANAITNLGITATKAELNFVDGVTSNIQTQLDGKQATGSYLTGNQTITLSGDVSGSGTTSIAVTIADDSHNHVISNVDGLQTALDAKLASSSYTAADVLTKIKTVDGAGSGLDADLLDGISSASFLRSDVSDVYYGRVLEFGNAGNGANTSGAFLTIEGNTDTSGEGSGRLFFREHNSTTANADNYGMSLGYRGGATTVTTAMGNSWTGLTAIGNGQWGMWGHDNSATGALIMYGDRAATFVNFASNNITGVGNITLSGTVDGRDVATDGAKLDGIAAGANNYSFPYTVSASASNSTVVQRHSSGYIFANYFNTTPNTVTSGITQICVETGNDGYIRHGTAAAVRTFINVENGATADQSASEILTLIKTVDGAGSGLDADLLDGISSGSFLRSDATDTFTTLTGTTLTVNGVLSVRNAIDLADNDILRFGSSDDVEFFCNGSHMYTDLNSGIGNWYIRDGTTTRFTFDDAGHFTATGNVTAYSDERLKDNILVIDNALEKVSQLRGVTFNRTDTEELHRQTGVIAQEVEKVLPEAVITADDEMQTKSVAYGNMVGLLIEAIKELKTEVNDLKKQLKEIK